MGLHGHNLQVARAFALSFNEHVPKKIVDIEIQGNKTMIAGTTHLLLKNEFSFKHMETKGNSWEYFLV
jgi:hypothetical protein